MTDPAGERSGGGEAELSVSDSEVLQLLEGLKDEIRAKNREPDLAEISRIFFDEFELRDIEVIFDDVLGYAEENGLDMDEIIGNMDFPFVTDMQDEEDEEPEVWTDQLGE